MDKLKSCSLRLEIDSLKWADKIVGYSFSRKRSDVLRLAIWIGTKVITSKNIDKLTREMVHDHFRDSKITLEGVLRTIGIELENLKKEE